eukprot:2038238-Pyramimonas_sp.AAC.1
MARATLHVKRVSGNKQRPPCLTSRLFRCRPLPSFNGIPAAAVSSRPSHAPPSHMPFLFEPGGSVL